MSGFKEFLNGGYEPPPISKLSPDHGNNHCGSMTVKASNPSGTTDGANALLVSVIQSMMSIENDNQIITGFEARVTFKERAAGEKITTEITSASSKWAEDIQVIGGLIKRITPDEIYLQMTLIQMADSDKWMTRDQFDQFVRRFYKLYCKAYGDAPSQLKGMAELGWARTSYIPFSDPFVDALNEIMPAKNLPFLIKMTMEDFTPPKYRLEWRKY